MLLVSLGSKKNDGNDYLAKGGYDLMLPNYRVLDRKLENLSFEETVRLQENRLKAQVFYCYEKAPFWRKKFDAIGLRPEDIKTLEDLTKIPFCTREDLQKDQEDNPPFGSYTASHPSTWMHYFSTSGTTGRPLKRIYSRRDWEYICQRYARSPFLEPGEVAMILGPSESLMGPTAVIDSFCYQGIMVVKAGRYDTRTKINLIKEIRPAAVSGTPSMLLYMGEVANETGVELSKAGVRIVNSVGEPGAGIKGTRERIMKTWGCQVWDGYGMTELFSLGRNCPFSVSLHIANDFVITEVVDPRTGSVLGAGQRGELVYTNIIGDTQPLLRYRSGDIGEMAKFGACQCGSTALRIVNAIEGRVDDMIWFKGMNIFPSAVEGIVRSFSDLSNEFEIVLDAKGVVQTLKVRAEASKGLPATEYEGLRGRLLEELKRGINVNADVEIIPEGTLKKTQYKGRRIRDNRPKE
ncbi:MAG: AMP-binding protein [Thermodesulfobacteriota bacterium]